MNRVEVFTDGACTGNPGPGGWGALLRYKTIEHELCGFESDSTNNRMELMAAIRALQSLKRSCEVDLTTDSQYVQRGITEWIVGWKRRGWKNSNGDEVKNRDLWELLELQNKRHKIRWHWVRGHSGHLENERVDQLARNAINAGMGSMHLETNG